MDIKILAPSIILFGFCFYFCSNHDEPGLYINSILPSDLPNYKLDYLDTVEFETDGDLIWILDKNKEFYLGINKSETKAYLFNTEGKIKTIINKVGPGPQEYGSISKLALTPSGNIVIVNNTKALTYDSSGKFLFECHNKFDFLVTGPPHASAPTDSTVIFSSVHPSNIAESEKYFRNQENFTSSSLSLFDCESTNFAPYEEASIYTKMYFPLNTSRMYAIEPTTKTLITLYPYDKNIYLYDLESKENIDRMETNPYYFKDVEGSKGGEGDLNTQLLLIQKNPSYRRLKVSNDQKVLLRYRLGRPEDEIYASLAKLNSSTFRPKAYFEVYDLNSKSKITGDILDTSGSVLFHFSSMDSLMFYTNDLHKTGLENTLHIIRAKILKEE